MAIRFFISNDKSKLDIGVIGEFLTNSAYWAKGRSRKTIEKSIKNSLCFGVYTDRDEQVGFARVVTDFAVFAWVTDLFIKEGYRGRGLGKLLVKHIREHPDLQGLQRWGLFTEDAHKLYEKYGFSAVPPGLMMEITQKPA